MFSPSEIATHTLSGIDSALCDSVTIAKKQLGEEGEVYAREVERQLLRAPQIIIRLEDLPKEIDYRKMVAILEEVGFVWEETHFVYPAVKL